MTASRTTPTLCVLVIITGPCSIPESSTQVVPVISPLPFSENQPAKTALSGSLPRGRTAVTPVRAGPMPTCNFPSPLMIVLWPTSTPLTSVIAFSRPGVPSNGTPRSRARGFPCGACPSAMGDIGRKAMKRVRRRRASFRTKSFIGFPPGLNDVAIDPHQSLGSNYRGGMTLSRLQALPSLKTQTATPPLARLRRPMHGQSR